jgi:molecular chaperone HtpG
MAIDTHKETLGFETEVTQLLDLMIHSLYSNKEIFLRELISNASDAADKLRFEALTDDAMYEGDSDLKISVDYDKEKNTVTISDNGIGMSRAEVVDHIGTIAKSGTQQFFKSLTGDQAKDSRLIGQFGVGFYSAFIVADKVILDTRRAGLGAEHGVRWASEGKGKYTLETIEKETRGTTITLHLKKSEQEFSDGFRLRNIIHKYSDHITLPIMMKVEEPAVPEDGKDDKDEAGEAEKYETVNSASALWTRAKKDIKDDEYKEFYKHVAHDFEDPMAWSHNRVEGKHEYTSLLYIPARAQFDLWDRNSRHGVKLYVQRVFIMDDAEQLMPAYLRFVRGVIDSSDLPLNVSREILQESKEIDGIRAGSVKKVLDTLKNMARKKPDEYEKFWDEFGVVLKEGLAEDHSNKDSLASLMRFASTKSENEKQNVSLDEYVKRMQSDQEKIYYITAETFSAAKNSPHLEIFRKKDIEVLLLTDRVDEWMLSGLTEYEGKSLHSVTKGDLDLGKLEDKEEKKKQEESAEEFKKIIDKVKEVLGDKVKDVRVTHRLTDSPSCLVADEHEMGANLERILKAAGQDVHASKPILEINPQHPLAKKLETETDDKRLSDWANILFDQAMLSEGGQLEDPASFVKILNGLLLESNQK